jgi:hypothetical protein
MATLSFSHPFETIEPRNCSEEGSYERPNNAAVGTELTEDQFASYPFESMEPRTIEEMMKDPTTGCENKRKKTDR